MNLAQIGGLGAAALTVRTAQAGQWHQVGAFQIRLDEQAVAVGGFGLRLFLGSLALCIRSSAQLQARGLHVDMHPLAVEGRILLGRFLHIGVGHAPAPGQQIDVREHGGWALCDNASHGRQADGHFAQQHNVLRLQVVEAFNRVHNAQPPCGLAQV